MMLDNFANSYLKLGLRIDKHINGYVEHYYGPSELKNTIEREGKKSPKNLLQDCENLKDELKDQGFEVKRRKFLEKNLDAIQTILKKLNGEKIPYLELVEKLFDFKPKLYKDKFFYDLSLKAEKLYKGKGDLSNRIREYSKRRKIPPNIIRKQFRKALGFARKQTIRIFPDILPDYEKIEVVEVKERSWSMYCWYLGNFFSRIEINIEKIHYWTNLLDYVTHEVYPGHHTERLVKDKLLYRNKGYFESSILLIYTPELVISEGMARVAERVIFDRIESSKILLEHLCPNPEIEDSIEILSKQSEIREGFNRFESNLAYHKYVNNWTNDELIKYSRSFNVIPDEGINALLDFISDELWGSYVQVYQGERIIKENLGNPPTPDSFFRLISEQTLPSDLL
ncbi:MAG: hypothetical protein ACXAAH_04715 [Promethearchaeota archaeon]|jgi:hypothetical protein